MAQENIEMVRVNALDFTKPIYVLLYHPWLEGFKKYFAAHLSWLRENGFESISLEDLIRYLRGEEALIPERPIAITLDDGTIENYTIAYPLLKKYGFTGTVFAPTADRYIRMSGRGWWKGVERGGILNIEGHSHSHAFIFIDGRIEDFFVRRKTKREPIIKGQDARPGAPIFRLGYELASKRFFPEKALIDQCVEFVKSQSRSSFFKKENWREKLFEIASNYKGNRGRYETCEEREERIREELVKSRVVIEETIGHGKEIRFFAYPFGAHNSELVRHLKGSGYIGAFTTEPGGNNIGDDPFLIKRMNMSGTDSFGGLSHILKEYGT